MIERDELKKLRKNSLTLEPILRLGKNGLTQGVISEIKTLVKKRGMIKIKLLKSFVMQMPANIALEKILHETHAQLVQKTGNVIVICKDVFPKNPSK
jgi:RNA-binding protein